MMWKLKWDLFNITFACNIKGSLGNDHGIENEKKNKNEKIPIGLD